MTLLATVSQRPCQRRGLMKKRCRVWDPAEFASVIVAFRQPSQGVHVYAPKHPSSVVVIREPAMSPPGCPLRRRRSPEIRIGRRSKAKGGPVFDEQCSPRIL